MKTKPVYSEPMYVLMRTKNLSMLKVTAFTYSVMNTYLKKRNPHEKSVNAITKPFHVPH